MGEAPEALRHQVLHWLSENVPESRLQHILRVEQMAIALAQKHDQDIVKAALAGLMHDLAKYFKPAVLLEMAQQEGLMLDPVDESTPHLLHAHVGAIVAREQFGVQDPEILAAIADHTLGRPGMSPLSCIVFLADSLEPGRGNIAELNVLRHACRQNLQQAVWMVCDYSLKQLMESRRLIHPRVILTRNWFLHQQGTARGHKGSARTTGKTVIGQVQKRLSPSHLSPSHLSPPHLAPPHLQPDVPIPESKLTLLSPEGSPTSMPSLDRANPLSWGESDRLGRA
ncbi:MAG: bis(5'-nucleosyl)-tetraphosphatase (symmetrical) YqeK [Oculatellaceae cyanobacterium Prado106]|jgi:predicted HD superfamily hydrolase involved in NAD metabolism|nr:bis(5'-nucleosyl)-tetraphosphatase (symmetrical) YqeK [Oculatellaceae cyanobacterium Prado106]